MVEDPLLDEDFLGVEVFVEAGADDAVAVDGDAVLLKEDVQIGVEAMLASLGGHDEDIASLFEKLLERGDL